MTIGVVIPCRNEADWIGAVLDALDEQDRQPDEVVVVDDGSSDGSGEAVEHWRREHPRLPVRLISGPSRGVAAAVNTGIAALGTDIVMRLDGHCRPAGDYVRRSAALAVEAGVGVAGGVWRIEPGAASLEAQAIAIAMEHPLGSGGARYRRPIGTAATGVDTVPFGCFRRALWQELGGLDERLWANEDYDFNYRVRQRGLKVVLDPAIRCTYYARPDIAGLARQYGRYGWWKARMLARQPRSIHWRQLTPALLVPGLVALGAGAIVRGGAVWLALLAMYPLAIVTGAVHAALARRKPSAIGWLAVAFFTIHLTWSAAFWASLPLAIAGKAGPDAERGKAIGA